MMGRDYGQRLTNHSKTAEQRKAISLGYTVYRCARIDLYHAEVGADPGRQRCLILAQLTKHVLIVMDIEQSWG
jgi:hypothetical protein